MSTRLPSLDGLRAISIIGVLYSHLSITPHFRFTDNPIVLFLLSLIAGDNGVNVFFVISGFLITSLLINEEGRNGKLNLKAFYIRRIFRILPVYLVFLLVTFVCSRFGWVRDMDVQSFLPPLTFTTGALPIATGWTLAHTWSLSVEEQFYLLWPLTLVMTHSMRTRNILIIGAILLIPILRAIYYYKTHNSLYYSFPVRGDAILMGCLLAVNRSYFEAAFASRLRTRLGLLALAALCYGVHFLAERQLLGMVTVPMGIWVHAAFASLLIIAYTIVPNTKSVFYGLLNSRVMGFIGVLSYSLYIWQQFFLQKAVTVVHGWKYFPINMVCVFCVAICSYYFLERPFLAIRKKFFA